MKYHLDKYDSYLFPARRLCQTCGGDGYVGGYHSPSDWDPGGYPSCPECEDGTTPPSVVHVTRRFWARMHTFRREAA